MSNNEALLKKRLAELSSRSAARGIWTYSEFLTTAEQSALFEMTTDAPYTLHGGYGGAERQIACFGSLEICGYESIPPVACLLALPVSKKYAEALTHRDFLGALMSLGMRREVLGDIAVTENGCYIFCLDAMTDYIAENLHEIRRTTVSCRRAEPPPEIFAKEPETREFVVSSERADAVTASVYGLSRAGTRELFSKGRVFINSRQTESVSRALDAGDVVSVRGYGRFIYDGAKRETRKKRLCVAVRFY